MTFTEKMFVAFVVHLYTFTSYIYMVYTDEDVGRGLAGRPGSRLFAPRPLDPPLETVGYESCDQYRVLPRLVDLRLIVR